MRIAFCLFFGSTSIVLASAVAGIAAPDKVFDVRQFGAQGDGRTLDTQSIQTALDECGMAGGGTVRFAPGTYLSQPLVLRSKTRVLLEKGATLKATDDPKDYLPDGVTWETARGSQFTPFISGKDLSDITLTGEGIIDGSGARWWGPAEEARRRQPGYTLPRPDLIRLTRVKRLKVMELTIQNSPKFHLVPDDCEDVWIEGVTILAPEGAANTDAIDPSVCQRVTITNCVIDVGDDDVAIKSGKKMPGRQFACDDITITDCVFNHGHGVSIGSETVGGVCNMVVKNCRFEGTENGIRIKSPRGRGGTIENLRYENLTMKDVAGAITFTCYYPRIPDSDTAQPVTAETPKFRNLTIRNLTATSTKAAGVIIGLPESPVENVVLEDVQITAEKTGLTIRNAKGILLKNVKITPQKGAPFVVQDAEVNGLPQGR